jgi:hypothetical protein
VSYAAALRRTSPNGFVLLIDQSSSMAQPFGAQPDYFPPLVVNLSDGNADLVSVLRFLNIGTRFSTTTR